MQNISYIIYGMHSRDEWINNLLEKIPNSKAVYDDRPNGGSPLYTCRKAWKTGLDTGSDWICVLQDDVIVCDNFCQNVEAIANNFKDTGTKLVSLFDFKFINLPLEYPAYKTFDTPYMQVDAISCCALLIKRDFIEPCLIGIWKDENITEEKLLDRLVPDDLLITHYCRNNNIQIIKTIPSIVQHIGDDSLVSEKNNSWHRVSNNYSQTVEVDWNNKKVFVPSVRDFCGALAYERKNRL